ncbi:MAG: GNAT family N-acetyltransferase [Bacillota bacterium]|jgi:ribosomal-protein-alanine N-acetyltransferase
MWEIKIGKGSVKDAKAIGELYLKSFPESAELFFNIDNIDHSNSNRVNSIAASGFELVLRSACSSYICYDQHNPGKLFGYCIVSTKNGLPVLRLFTPRNIGKTIGLSLIILSKLSFGELMKLGRNSLMQIKKSGDDTPKRLPGGRIISIAVHPDARGLGLGKALLKEALDFLGKNKIRATYLEVRPNNLPAKKMYEKMGFYQYGATQDLQGPWLRLVRVNN